MLPDACASDQRKTTPERTPPEQLGGAPGTDGAASLARSASLLRADLQQLAEQYHAAGDAMWRAAVALDRGAMSKAEDLRWEAQGQYHAACSELADLFIMGLRLALDHRPEALLMYHTQAIRPELEALAALALQAKGGRP